MFSYGERPPKAYRSHPVVNVLRWVPLGIVLLTGISIAVNYASIPAELPQHFDLSGQVTSYGSKAMLWLLIGVFTVLQFGMGMLSLNPHIFNVPITLTHNNAQQVYRFSEVGLIVMNLLCAALVPLLVLMMLQPEDPVYHTAVLAVVALILASLAGMLAGFVLIAKKHR